MTLLPNIYKENHEYSDINKAILENIDIYKDNLDIDIDKDILENIGTFENIDIIIDIAKKFLKILLYRYRYR